MKVGPSQLKPSVRRLESGGDTHVGRIDFSGQLTEAEFLRLNWLGTHWLLRQPAWFIVLPGIMMLASGGYDVIAADPIGQSVRIVPLLFLLAFMLIGPRYLTKRNWRNNPLARAPVTGSVDDQSVEWNGPYTTGRFPWGAFLKRKSADDMVLLYTAPNAALYFPRSFFPDEIAWQAFRAIAEVNVPRTR